RPNCNTCKCPTSVTTNIIKPNPFGPATGNNAATSNGSVVGSPCLSTAQVFGIDLCLDRASNILPHACTVVAISNNMGSPLFLGEAKAIGFVPKYGSVPPKGTTIGSD